MATRTPQGYPDDPLEQIDRLRAELVTMTDLFSMLLKDGFPKKGRSDDDRESYVEWWEMRSLAIEIARAAVAGMSYEEFRELSDEDQESAVARPARVEGVLLGRK